MVFHRAISVAPMVGVTDSHYRVMARMLSKHVDLYTEMYVARAVLRDRNVFNNIPYVSSVTCQIAGNNSQTINEAIGIANSTGLFAGFNINLGCPASSANSGEHGAILLKDRAKLIKLMLPISEYCHNNSINLSCKLRIGVDEFTSYEWFISLLRDLHKEASINHFIVHARPARLDLNTQQNRVIPSLNYEYVFRAIEDMNREFPNQIRIDLNGGISTINQIHQLSSQTPCLGLGGYMIGRWFQKNLIDLRLVDDAIGILNNQSINHTKRMDPAELIAEYCSTYLVNFPRSTSGFGPIRPLFSLFNGEPGSRMWRHDLQRGRQ